jgi:DNA transformation protein and related proteins
LFSGLWPAFHPECKKTMPREPFGSPDPSVQHLIDLMARFGPVQARAMFGGHGFYREGVMFALLADGALYLKVDPLSLPVFVGRNLRAFSFTAKGRTVKLSYHEAPAEALEEEAEMAVWCDLAWQAALRAKAKGGRAGSGRTRSMAVAPVGGTEPFGQDGLSGLPNLGPRSVESLAAAGITSLAQLQGLGAVRAFVRARAHNRGVSLNLLWALEGALTGRRWQDVAQADRASLLMALEDVQRADQAEDDFTP